MDFISPDEISVRKMHDEVIECLNTHEIAKLLSLFTEDTILMENNAPIIKGRDRIAKLLAGHKEKNLTLNLFYNIEELEIFGSRAFVRGQIINTTFNHDNTPVYNIGKFISLSQKQANGQWLRSHVIVNSDGVAK